MMTALEGDQGAAHNQQFHLHAGKIHEKAKRMFLDRPEYLVSRVGRRDRNIETVSRYLAHLSFKYYVDKFKKSTCPP